MPQSLSSILIHLVFSTKNRAPYIIEEAATELHKYLATIFKACDSPALLIGGDCDHLHALFSLARTWTIADVVKEVKASSSKWMKTKVGEFQWQAGYGAFSIGQSGVAGVKTYIANQKEHHRKQSFQDEFRGMCRNYSGFQMGAPASCGQSVQRVTFPPESTTCQVQPAGCGRTDLKTAISGRD